MTRYDKFESYEKEYYGLWFGPEKRLESALEICLEAYELYKEHLAQILMDLIMLNFELDKIEESKIYFNQALDKGYWYPEHYIGKILKHNMFEKENLLWTLLRDRCKGGMVYQTLLPKDFDESHSYPLMVSLHGWGEDLNLFKQFWTSQYVEDHYIHVMVQSSQQIGHVHYVWNDFKQAKDDIDEAVDELRDNYKLSETIIIGGFSQGGGTALRMAQDNPTVFSGVVALNPSRLDGFDACKLKDYNIGVSIITGDQDHALLDQKYMVEKYQAESIKVTMHIKEGMGHWFPDDLDKRLQDSIVFIEGL